MFIERIQPKVYSPIKKSIVSQTSATTKKLKDVVLTPWEFDKMINESKDNVTKKYKCTKTDCPSTEAYHYNTPGYDIC